MASALPSDACLVPRPFSADFDDCAVYAPRRYVPADSRQKPLRPICWWRLFGWTASWEPMGRSESGTAPHNGGGGWPSGRDGASSSGSAPFRSGSGDQGLKARRHVSRRGDLGYDPVEEEEALLTPGIAGMAAGHGDDIRGTRERDVLSHLILLLRERSGGCGGANSGRRRLTGAFRHGDALQLA